MPRRTARQSAAARSLRKCAFLVLGVLTGVSILPSCREESKVDVAARINPDKMATMTTVNVSTFISDSGVIQYKIVSPLWKAYENVDTPYWVFPKGVYLQKYDRFFHVIATVAADSAKFFERQNLWRLDGNVEITKVPGDLFLSQQLFWDQRKKEVRSDSFIHIERAEQIIEGVGFKSNERMTIYELDKPMGIFPVSTLMRKDTTNTETNNQ